MDWHQEGVQSKMIMEILFWWLRSVNTRTIKHNKLLKIAVIVALLTLSFVTKSHHLRVKICFYWHVYGSTNCLKIDNDVTQTIFVAVISDNVWQSSCILRTLWKSKLFLTNLSGFPISINIFLDVHVVDPWQLEAEFWKYLGFKDLMEE